MSLFLPHRKTLNVHFPHFLLSAFLYRISAATYLPHTAQRNLLTGCGVIWVLEDEGAGWNFSLRKS